MTLQQTNLAPNFQLMSDSGQTVQLHDLQGQGVILYFYPKDNTSGCTIQACNFRDHLADFQRLNIQVLGISRDSIHSHIKFRTQNNLNFPLLVDEMGEVCQAFGVWVEKSMYGKKYFGIERTTFLLDEKSIILHVWNKIKVTGHVQEIIHHLSKI